MSTEATSIPCMTPRQAILHSADLLLLTKGTTLPKPTIQVQGQVSLWDPQLQRLDISHQGAKLIVRTTNCKMDLTIDENGGLPHVQLGNTVVVEGVLKKQQRRTFLEATKVQIVSGE